MHFNRIPYYPFKYFGFLSLLLIASCSTTNTLCYQSGANDVADIRLNFYKNQKFKLYFKELQETKSKTYTFKGKWNDQKESYQLRFKLSSDGKPDVKALFDPSITSSRTVRIIDRSTVEFKKSSKTIYVWGLPCSKIDLKKK